MATAEQTVQRKKKFLAHFARMGNISRAAKVAGVGRTMVYEWQEHDEAFHQEFKQAQIESVEVLDAEAWRRAHTGTKTKRGIYDRNGKLITTEVETKYSDVLLMFLLKSRDRAKYGDPTRYNVDHGFPAGAPTRPDYSNLTDEELDALDHLVAKAALGGARLDQG